MAGSSYGQEQPERSTLLIGDDQGGQPANEPVNSIRTGGAFRLACGAIVDARTIALLQHVKMPG